MTASALYEGTVRHRRFAVRRHELEHRVPADVDVALLDGSLEEGAHRGVPVAREDLERSQCRDRDRARPGDRGGQTRAPQTCTRAFPPIAHVPGTARCRSSIARGGARNSR